MKIEFFCEKVIVYKWWKAIIGCGHYVAINGYIIYIVLFGYALGIDFDKIKGDDYYE